MFRFWGPQSLLLKKKSLLLILLKNEKPTLGVMGHIINGPGLDLARWSVCFLLLCIMGSQVAQWWRICLPMQEMQEMEFNPWAGKISWNRKWQPTPVILPEKLHGQRSLVDYSVCSCKELDTAEHAHTHTHSAYTFTVLITLIKQGKRLIIKRQSSQQKHTDLCGVYALVLGPVRASR